MIAPPGRKQQAQCHDIEPTPPSQQRPETFITRSRLRPGEKEGNRDEAAGEPRRPYRLDLAEDRCRLLSRKYRKQEGQMRQYRQPDRSLSALPSDGPAGILGFRPGG